MTLVPRFQIFVSGTSTVSPRGWGGTITLVTTKNWYTPYHRHGGGGGMNGEGGGG